MIALRKGPGTNAWLAEDPDRDQYRKSRACRLGELRTTQMLDPDELDWPWGGALQDTIFAVDTAKAPDCRDPVACVMRVCDGESRPIRARLVNHVAVPRDRIDGLLQWMEGALVPHSTIDPALGAAFGARGQRNPVAGCADGDLPSRSW